MKRILAFLLIFPIFFCVSVHASDVQTSANANTTANQIEITAKSGILIDQQSGKVLFEKNSHERMPMASVTKIMTMLLVMEAIENKQVSMSDMVTASAHAASMGGTQIWLKENEQMSVHDLLKACAIASANDAAMALAEFVGGSEENFVYMMNEKAKALSMNDTVFVNPTGLDADGHFSSAYDIALMSKELLKHAKITEFTSSWMDSLRDGKTELVNTNKLVRFYKGCTGLKTGTTSKAGSCVSVSASRDDLSLISVVMGCETSKDRFDSARKLLDFGFSTFTSYKISSDKVTLSPVKVKGGIKDSVNTESSIDMTVLIKKSDKDNITQSVEITDTIEAPVKKGQKLGCIKVTTVDEEIASFDIVALEDVEKMNFMRAFMSVLCSFFAM